MAGCAPAGLGERERRRPMLDAIKTQRTAAPAIVAKADLAHHEAFLKVSESGEPTWVAESRQATAFASLREATRMAMRLPGVLRAYSVPLGAELAAQRLH